MPAEAVHVSALSDSIVGSAAASMLSVGGLRDDARLGAVMIDLPYFDRFALGVARYLLGRPVAVSRWGDAFHRRAPVALGKGLLTAARRLRARASSRQDADRVLAVALGYFSHVAVDRVLHPLVDAQARARAARLRDSVAHQHAEVEKFHSVLLHEERLGFDFMGKAALAEHIGVDARATVELRELSFAWRDAVIGAIGAAPEHAARRRWARGYGQYVALLSSPAGKLLVPERVKAEVRPEVYDGVFAAEFTRAVELSRRTLDAALALVDTGDDAAFDAAVPEGSIDPPEG